MRNTFWITAAALFGLTACMPAAAPPPPPAPVDVMGEVMEAEPEPVAVVCNNGVCAPAN